MENNFSPTILFIQPGTSGLGPTWYGKIGNIGKSAEKSGDVGWAAGDLSVFSSNCVLMAHSKSGRQHGQDHAYNSWTICITWLVHFHTRVCLSCVFVLGAGYKPLRRNLVERARRFPNRISW